MSLGQSTKEQQCISRAKKHAERLFIAVGCASAGFLAIDADQGRSALSLLGAVGMLCGAWAVWEFLCLSNDIFKHLEDVHRNQTYWYLIWTVLAVPLIVVIFVPGMVLSSPSSFGDIWVRGVSSNVPIYSIPLSLLSLVLAQELLRRNTSYLVRHHVIGAVVLGTLGITQVGIVSLIVVFGWVSGAIYGASKRADKNG